MNIFVLDRDPSIAASYHCDAHVVKMPLEAAQIACTVLASQGVIFPGSYKPTHQNHPCTLWAGETRENYLWLCELGLHLVREHGLRYSHTKAGRDGHRAGPLLRVARNLADSVPAGALTEHPLVMPEVYQVSGDVVTSYRRFYQGEKACFARWRTPSSPPPWWP